MTPVVVAHRIAHICFRAATGELGAKAELDLALPALEFFDAEVSAVFVDTLSEQAFALLHVEYGVEIAAVNPHLASLLTERCMP